MTGNNPSGKKFLRSSPSVHVRRRDLLRFADFRRLMSAQGISQVADAATTVFVAQFVLFASNDGPTTTLLLHSVLTAAIPLFLAGPISGVLADSFSRRANLWIGQLIRVLICLGLLSFAVVENRYAVVLLYGCAMCASKVLYTVRNATIRHLVRQHELVAADSLLLTVGNIAAASGGLLGVIVLQFIGPYGLAIAAMGHLTAAFVFGRIHTSLGGGREHESISWTEASRSLLAPKTRFAIASTGSHRLLFGVIFSTSALVLDSSNPNSYALLLASSGAGVFLGNLTAEWVNEHLPRRSMTVFTFVWSSLVAALTFAAPVVHVVLPTIFMTAFLFQNLRVCSDATVQKNAVRGAGGRIFAIYDLQFNSCFLIGLSIGLLADTRINPLSMYASASVVFALGAIGFGLMNRETWNQVATTDIRRETIALSSQLPKKLLS